MTTFSTYLETAYFGIWKVRTEMGWFLYEDRHGFDEFTGSEPTNAQVTTFRSRHMERG